jgi:hypothetical protein
MAAEGPDRSVGYELRTHLVVIKGYAQMVIRMLRRPDTTAEDVLPHAEALDQQIDRMQRAVERVDDEAR